MVTGLVEMRKEPLIFVALSKSQYFELNDYFSLFLHFVLNTLQHSLLSLLPSHSKLRL